MSGGDSNNFRPKPRRALSRGAARVSAVQALYQIELSGTAVDTVVREFVQFRLTATDESGVEGDKDRGLFIEIVRGASQRRKELDEMIAAVLAKGWSIERMDRVLLQILRAAAYELMARKDIPPRVTITQYVDVARAFFDGKEPGFVNGALDKLAHILRADELQRGEPRPPAGSDPPAQ
ncbi:MAG: transcription antitermination factor NusB [Alphaproteobacteria bacterium]